MTETEFNRRRMTAMTRRLSMIAAVGLAEAEEAQARARPLRREEVLNFLPRAASDGVTRMPRDLISLEDENFVLSVERGEGRLTMVLEGQGLDRAEELADRRAFVESRDGALAVEFRFGFDGVARIDLADEPRVHAALVSGLRVALAP